MRESLTRRRDVLTTVVLFVTFALSIGLSYVLPRLLVEQHPAFWPVTVAGLVVLAVLVYALIRLRPNGQQWIVALVAATVGQQLVVRLW